MFSNGKWSAITVLFLQVEKLSFSLAELFENSGIIVALNIEILKNIHRMEQGSKVCLKMMLACGVSGSLKK